MVLWVTPHSNILGMIQVSRTLILQLTIWTLLLIQSLAHVDGEEDCGVVEVYAPASPHHTPCCRCWLCCGHSAETTSPPPSAHRGYWLSSWCQCEWSHPSVCLWCVHMRSHPSISTTDISKPNIEAGPNCYSSYSCSIQNFPIPNLWEIIATATTAHSGLIRGVRWVVCFTSLCKHFSDPIDKTIHVRHF